MLLSILKERGLMIDDIEDWVENVNEDNVTFRGEFSRAGVRQVGILIEQLLSTFQNYDRWPTAFK